jgi:hypothetical protein
VLGRKERKEKSYMRKETKESVVEKAPRYLQSSEWEKKEEENGEQKNVL